MSVRYFCGFCRASYSSTRDLIRHENNAHDRLGRLQAEKELAKSLLGRGQISDEDLYEMIADITRGLRKDYR
jgi:hypothetical protein